MIFAFVTEQGTAAPETALCVIHLEAHANEAREAADKDVDTSRFIDCTGNELVSCIVCGSKE